MIPALYRGLCDDAALFPPAATPLSEAVAAHQRLLSSPLAEFVGPFVAPASALAVLPAGMAVSVTVPDGPALVAAALRQADATGLDVRSVEVAVPVGQTVAGLPGGVVVYVEIPRDDRRAEVIAACARHRHRAKFRTGGITATMYPGALELAAGVSAVVEAGVAFKATAGLHHALRNTDPHTGFEQHGFLNLLLTVDAALQGVTAPERLEWRDAEVVTAAVAELDEARVAAVRGVFVSFGTCSVTEPWDELDALGLLSTVHA